MSLDEKLHRYVRAQESGERNPEEFGELLSLAAAEGRFPLLIERLSQARAWRDLGEASKRALAEDPGVQAARAYLKAHDAGEAPALGLDELMALVDLLPDDARAIRLYADALFESGSNSDEALRLIARSLQLDARAGDFEHLEEGLLRLLEAREPGPLRAALSLCVAGARAGHISEAVGFFDLALPKFAELDLADEAWVAARRIIEKLPDAESFRPAAVSALRARLASVPAADAIVAASEIERKYVPLPDALARLDRLLRFLPGTFVEHSGWGVGRIRSVDLEWVTVAFASVGEKMMRHDLALKSLSPIATDDLRVLLATDRRGVLSMAQEDPAGVLVLALRRLGGEGSGADIRRVLEGAVIPAPDWAAWWKTAREKARLDPRIDTGQAFRQIYRIAEPGSAEAAVPRIEDGGAPLQNVALLRRFLEHNPDSAAAVRARYLPELERWLRGTHAGAQDRGTTILLLLEWEPDREAQLMPQLLQALAEGFDVSALTTPDEQRRVLAHASSLEPAAREALLSSALSSRYPEVRDAAFEAVLASGANAARLVQDLLAAPSEKNAALFALATHLLSSDGALPYGPWDIVRGLVTLLESRPGEATAQRALRFLSTEADLVDRARAETAPSRVKDALRSAVLEWRGSDRFLFPVVEFLESSGMVEIADALRGKRTQAGERLAARAAAAPADAAPAGVWMTRASYQALLDEIREIGLALKTTIPETIRKARELGDLRENAEYAAAKGKQAQFAKRMTDLESKVRIVRIIEDQALNGEVAAPGTEVELAPEAGGPPLSYWILGEGDQRYGENVVSCLAPLGRALMGKKVGDTADLGEGSGRHTVTAIRVRLPGNPADPNG